MSRATIPPPKIRTLADLLKRLGDIPLERIRFNPPPGTATEDDVIAADTCMGRACELIDGTLVEKAMGAPEAYIAWLLGGILKAYLDQNNLGIGLASDGLLRLSPGLVRIPDLPFISWDKFPGRKVPLKPIFDLYPDLAIEVISPSNTPAEIRRKLREYFAAGVRLAWVIDPRKRSARAYTSPLRSVLIREDQSLDGGEVLPGFTVRLAELFRNLEAG